MDFTRVDHLAILELKLSLAAGGLKGGLEFLNARVPHRFTALYKFERDSFKLMAFVDKMNQAVPDLFVSVPFDDSFCQYSVGLGEFVTTDAMGDKRLDGHIHQATVASYVGLPLTLPPDGLYGTFCHLDLVAQQVSDDEFAFLQKAALVLARNLPMRDTTYPPRTVRRREG
jgi:GAF domain-containing protein